ncbi:Hypothetical predicted protein [Paramuricea clavata]|uniref:Uncharacterized protein n=1 Tax=Paramuricea clavata TaxID=317549 RepID=A0A7D9EXX4_PARCT|nr:Hypothetical predicted protein [Paramuricea clavata]
MSSECVVRMIHGGLLALSLKSWVCDLTWLRSMEENIVEIEGIYVQPQSCYTLQTELSDVDEPLTDDQSIAVPPEVDTMEGQRYGEDGNVPRSGEAIVLQNVLKITSAIDPKPLKKPVLGYNRMGLVNLMEQLSNLFMIITYS